MTKPTITEFDPPAELVAERQAAVRAGQALTAKVRALVKAAGPSGVRAGVLILELVLNGEDIARLLDATKALELTGLIRLEGVRTIVSEELDEALVNDGPFNGVEEQPTLAEGRHDRGWPTGTDTVH